jgi:hypothetical protein
VSQALADYMGRRHNCLKWMKRRKMHWAASTYFSHTIILIRDCVLVDDLLFLKYRYLMERLSLSHILALITLIKYSDQFLCDVSVPECYRKESIREVYIFPHLFLYLFDGIMRKNFQNTFVVKNSSVGIE